MKSKLVLLLLLGVFLVGMVGIEAKPSSRPALTPFASASADRIKINTRGNYIEQENTVYIGDKILENAKLKINVDFRERSGYNVKYHPLIGSGRIAFIGISKGENVRVEFKTIKPIDGTITEDLAEINARTDIFVSGRYPTGNKLYRNEIITLNFDKENKELDIITESGTRIGTFHY